MVLAQFYILSEQREKKNQTSQEYIISRLKKKKKHITMCIVSQNVISTCEGSFINQRSTNIGILGKEAFNICF